MGVFITFALVVAGVVIVGVARTDIRTERAYGLLALALLATVTLGYLWPPVLRASAYADSSGTDDLAYVLVAGLAIVATILAVALPGIVRLIEMAVANQWRWFGGLLAVIAAMALLPPVMAPLFQVAFSKPNLSPERRLLASE
jgi:hypothetical protein